MLFGSVAAFQLRHHRHVVWLQSDSVELIWSERLHEVAPLGFVKRQAVSTSGAGVAQQRSPRDAFVSVTNQIKSKSAI